MRASKIVNYTNNTTQLFTVGDSIITGINNSNLQFIKYGLFAQISKTYLANTLSSSFGLRIDGNSFTKSTNSTNLSPRLSLAYNINSKTSINTNIGRFHQLPSYTILGFENNGNYLNKDASYISCDHAVLGIEYNPSSYSKITLESFYKSYNNYPFSILDSISLANLGDEFGVIGNEDISSISKGNSYGFELLAQQKMSSSIYGILSATYYFSRFEDKDGNLISSSWDNRFILNMTAGKKFKKNWEIGVKFRFSGGSPYTPFDTLNSSYIQVWDVANMGLLDYNQLNELRLKANHGLDIRIDKKWYWKKMALNLYLDIQNAYNFQSETAPSLIVPTDDNGNRLINSNDPSRYQTKLIENVSGTLLPSIGLQFEF